MADASIIELLDDMHLSSQSKFSDYYYAMQSNNISYANTILNDNPELKNQMIIAQNVNSLIEGVNERELEPITDIDYYLQDLLNQFQDMINNTKIMGQFDSSLQYYPHNFVYYQGKGYYAFAQPPLGTLPTDIQYWIEYDIKGLQGYGGIDLNLRYNWDNSLNYKVGDVVVYKNRLWYALADNTGTVPNLNHYPWVIISLPQMPNRTPIQKAMPQSGYSTGDFWFQITDGEEVITTTWGIRQSEATPRFSSGAFTIGDNIYVVGGILPNFSLSNKNEMYDTLTGTWSEKASLSSDRARFGYFSIGNNGYIVGGLTDNGVVTDKVESYNPTTNTWTTKASLPIKMITDAVSDETYGYVFGGVNENGQIVPTSYIYNPTQDTWTAISDKPTATRGHSLVYANGFIYAIGGINSLEETVGNVEVYDITTKTYSTKANMITPRSYLGTFHKAGTIYAIGGLNNDWYSLDINEKFNIEKNQWEADMPMNYPRSSLTTAVSGNKAYAIGGIDIGTSTVGGYNEEYGIKDIPSNFEMTVDLQDGLDFGIKTNTISTNNFYIDWGDSTESDIITASNTEVNHTYTEAGEYVVKIIGNTTGFKINKGNKNLKSVDKSILSFTNIDAMFENCSNLVSIPTGIFDNSPSITTAIRVFFGCSSLQVIPAGLFDQNINITDFSNTFSGTGITSIPNGLFNRNNLVTNFTSCFAGCSNITIIPEKLFDYNISVTNFSSCFSNCTKLETIPNNLFVNNSYCENYSHIFENCTSLRSTFKNIFKNAIGAKDFSNAFNGCKELDDIPDELFKDASNATNYTDVFKNARRIREIPAYTFNGNNATFTLPLSQIQNIGNYGMNGLNIPQKYFKDSVVNYIGSFIFSDNITDYTSMFEGASKLSTIEKQDFSNVTALDNIFTGCILLKTVGGFFNKETNEPALKKSISFIDCPLDSTSVHNIKDSLITLTSSTTQSLEFNSNSLNYLTDAEKYAIINKYWTLPGWDKPTITSTLAEQIVQEIYGEEGYTYTQSMYETGLYFEVDLINSQTTAVIMRYYVDKTTGLVYEVGEEPTKEYRAIITDNAQTDAAVYISKGADNDPNGQVLRNYIANNNVLKMDVYNTENLINLDQTFKGLTKLQELTIRNSKNVTSFSQAFAGCAALTTVKLDTDSATTFENMFTGCLALSSFKGVTSDTINTSNVTNMRRMFYGCVSMSGLYGESYPIFSDTSKVTTMEEMFVENSMEGLSDGGWTIDMTNVTNASKMFADCTSLMIVNISNVEKIQNASYMFSHCENLRENRVGSLTFSNCTNATGMFQYTGFNSTPTNVSLPKATNMSYIFAGCTNLGTLKGGFFPSTVQDVSNAFQGCTSLVNMPSDIKTVFGSNNNLTNVSYLFDGCTALKQVGEHFIFKYVEDPILGYDLQLDSALLDKQLFRNCPNITDMSYMFRNCKNLGNVNITTVAGTQTIGIPTGFFYWCPKVTTISHVFDGCTNILNHLYNGINNYLFAKNTELTDVSYAFANSSFGALIDSTDEVSGGQVFGKCTKIQNAKYLFTNATASYNNEYTSPCFIYNSKALTNIEGMYSGFKSAMRIPDMNVDYVPAAMDWSKLNTIVPNLQTCNSFFANCSLLEGDTDTANVLTVINSLNNISSLTNHAAAFRNCTKLPNYSSIPSGWK